MELALEFEFESRRVGDAAFEDEEEDDDDEEGRRPVTIRSTYSCKTNSRS